MKKQILLLSSFLVGFLSLNAQQNNLSSVHNDTLLLHMDSLPNALIQWQQSEDGIVWNDVTGATTFTWQTQVNTLAMPQYYRAEITETACEPWFGQELMLDRDMPTYYWSDPQAWPSGNVPELNDLVMIPGGVRILLDVSPPALSGLQIVGVLEFMERDLHLETDYISLSGTLQIGTESNLFEHQATITLRGRDTAQNIMGMGTRGILVMGGSLELHGAVPQVIWTKINQHAPAGSQQLDLIQNPDWQVGEQIVISPTDYYQAGNGASESQVLTLTNVSGDQLLTQEALNAHRWGLLQYANSNGISLSANSLLNPPIADSADHITPLVLDERAHVGHMSRNILIEAPDDTLWQNLGFGAHVMMMSEGSVAHIEGVQFRRAGQRGRLGRYPVHWHMLSYDGVNFLSDASGQYLRNSVINRSTNRGVVIHGTNGLLLSKNIIFDVEGHGIFTEDAVERRNVMDSNLVLKVRNPLIGLKMHEIGSHGSSGFWISNPDNQLTNNVAADCRGKGYWLAFPTNPWGTNSGVLEADGLVMNPSRIRFGVFDRNTAHSNGREGIMLDEVEIDNQGNTYPHQYASTIDGRDYAWPYPTLRRFNISNSSLWKNAHNGLWDRSVWPDTYGTVSADNCQRFFAGSGADGVIERSLVVGTSLNHLMNGTDRPQLNFAQFPNGDWAGTPSAFATYHSTFDIRNNIVMHFDAVVNTWSGAFSTDDYYIRAVDKGHYRNVNNLLVQCYPGVKLKSWYDYYTLASALWDPQGLWGVAGNYFVYDDPFLTYGKTITPVAPDVLTSGGVSVAGPFYGFEGFVLHGVGNNPPQNQPWMDLMGFHVRRLDQQLNEVAHWTVQPAPAANALLSHMRDFATVPEGIYELTFPQETVLPTNFQMNVENMLTLADTQVMAVSFDCSLNPIVTLGSPGNVRVYTPVNSIAEVQQSAGETYFVDITNNLVWFKIQGGYWSYWTNDPTVAEPTNDELLYNPSTLRIYQP